MANINFQPVFDYIDSKIEVLKEELPSKADFQNLKNSVDSIARRFDASDKEAIVGKAKTERIEHWVVQAADKIELPYNP